MIEKTLNYYKLQTGPSSSSYFEIGPYFSSPRKVPLFSFFSDSGAPSGDPQQKREWRGSKGRREAASWRAVAPTSKSGTDTAPVAAASSSRRAASGTVPQLDQAHWDGHLSLFQVVTPTRCVGDEEVMEVGSSGGQAMEEEEMGRIWRGDETGKGKAAFKIESTNIETLSHQPARPGILAQ
ncbi:hypothetical protein M9H77_11266 [Catharanthus roseus]|uniref:Uncharacterized protein n=1 Tax=Catharanthus roseus TaxID=4058 RepID=A0ACC0BE83_CATRO|nr:hypothetical protein M9H77_11266 [Catharanthus roseus]